MSPLAFDKQGNPFSWSRQTRKLRVRLFRNPSARGTCCQVLDQDGEPLYVDAGTDYAEFRRAVGAVPGLYRLDQCDEAGDEIDDTQPAYVSIDVTRNLATSSASDVSPLAIIEHMFATHADVMKTMAMQQASIMAASAEIMRAPLRPTLPTVAPSPVDDRELEEDDADDDPDDDADAETEEQPDPWAAWRPLLKMAEPHLPKFGAFLYEQFMAYLKTTKPSPAAALPPIAPTPGTFEPTVPSESAHPEVAAAGASASAPPASVPGVSSTVATSAPTHPNASADEDTVTSTANTNACTTTSAGKLASSITREGATPSPDTTSNQIAASAAPTTSATNTSSSPAASSGAATDASAEPRNAALIPTREQVEHLAAIRERLTPKESAIAEGVITRMTPEQLAHWIAELMTQSPDEAAQTIRSVIKGLRNGPPRRS